MLYYALTKRVIWIIPARERKPKTSYAHPDFPEGSSWEISCSSFIILYRKTEREREREREIKGKIEQYN
jgi:hypothetical protein